MFRSLLLLFVLCVLQLVCVRVHAINQYGVYRAIQYSGQSNIQSSNINTNNNNANPLPLYGSQRTTLSGPLYACTSLVAIPLRHVPIIAVEHFEFQQLKDLIEKDTPPVGLLIIVSSSSQSSSNTVEFNKLEHYLLLNSVSFPIYLIEKNHQLLHDTSQSKFINIPYSDASYTSVSLPSIIGHLYGSSDDTSTIAVLVTIDEFRAFPAAKFLQQQQNSTTNQNNAVLIALELMRQFSSLYSNAHSRPSSNLMFLLVPTGLSHVGVRALLRQLNNRQVENIEMVLCIDELRPVENVGFYVSKLPKSPHVQRLYSTLLNHTSSSLSVEMHHKKINMSTSFIPYAHELFARKRIVAATISTRKHRVDNTVATASSSLSAAQQSDVLQQQLQWLSQGIMQLLYRDLQANVNYNTLLPQAKLTKTLALSVSALNRMQMYYDDNTRYINVLQQECTNYLQDAKKLPLVIDMKFYMDNNANIKQQGSVCYNEFGCVEAQVYETRTATSQLYDSFLIASYLFVLFIVCKQPKNIQQFIQIFTGK